MPTSTELWLIRHGETVSNENGVIQGQYDAQLSEKGRNQARLLAQRIALIPPNAIYSSDLSRAKDTAQIIADVCGLPIAFDARLREVDMGIWSNRPIEEVAHLYPSEWKRSKMGDPDLQRGGGETAIEVQKRMVEVIAEIIEKHRGQITIVVSHGISIRAYLAHFLDLALANAYRRILLSSAGITCIRPPENGNPEKLVSLNDVCHLNVSRANREGF